MIGQEAVRNDIITFDMTSTVYIAKNVYGGDGMGRLGDGRVVFVPGAFAGENTISSAISFAFIDVFSSTSLSSAKGILRVSLHNVNSLGFMAGVNLLSIFKGLDNILLLNLFGGLRKSFARRCENAAAFLIDTSTEPAFFL